jgi:hypothetical protein
MEVVVLCFKVLPQHLLEIIGETHEKFGRNNLSPGQILLITRWRFSVLILLVSQ